MIDYIVTQTKQSFFPWISRQIGIVTLLGGAAILISSLTRQSQPIDLIISGLVILLGGYLFLNNRPLNINFWNSQSGSRGQFQWGPQAWQYNGQSQPLAQPQNQQERQWIEQMADDRR
ncbi:MAG TPA: hypothetical protein VJG83_00325 [archaeon]|nr:hypothetical protein [archaeon]